ncbi:hypothetical protein D3C84_1171630 [compost metagenome]
MQRELQVDKRQVHGPLGDFLSGRLRDVAELLRRSRVPLMMFSTGEEALGQLRLALGRLTGSAR